jgi:exodeoxyribonuclease VII large subunit
MPASTLRQFTAAKRHDMDRLESRLTMARTRRLERPRDRLTHLQERLDASLKRVETTTRRAITQQTARLVELHQRLDVAMMRGSAIRRDALARLDRVRQTLGYKETLKRGFAVVHGPDGLLTSAKQAKATPQFEVEFSDGRMTVQSAGKPVIKRAKPKDPEQKTLL